MVELKLVKKRVEIMTGKKTIKKQDKTNGRLFKPDRLFGERCKEISERYGNL